MIMRFDCISPHTPPLETAAAAEAVRTGTQSLSDDLMTLILVRVPLVDHGAASSACARWSKLVASPRFAVERASGACIEHGIAVIAGGDDACAIYNVGFTRILRRLPPYPHAVTCAGSAWLQGKGLVVVGGRSNTAVLRAVWVCAPDFNDWQRLADLPEPRASARCVSLGGRVYAIGGEDSRHHRASSCYCYNPQRDVWDTLPDMPCRVAHFALGEIDGHILVCGGYASNTCRWVSTVQVFDPATSTWTFGPEFLGHETCWWASTKSAVLDGQLYVFGGRGGLVKVFDGKSWSEGPRLPDDRSAECALSTSGGAIIILASVTSPSTHVLAEVEVLVLRGGSLSMLGVTASSTTPLVDGAALTAIPLG